VDGDGRCDGAIGGRRLLVLGKRAIFERAHRRIATVALLVRVKARKVPGAGADARRGAAGLILRGGSVR